MATFYANPNEDNELWIETAAIDGYGFRIWHVIFFCFAGFTVFVILICCCIKFRVPRTKIEIEADYRRKKLAEKFRQRLLLIQNQDMDAMDLKTALDIIQQDYKNENQNITELSKYGPSDINSGTHKCTSHMKAEPQISSFAQNMTNIMRIAEKTTKNYSEV